MNVLRFVPAVIIAFLAMDAHAQRFDQGDVQQVVVGQPVPLSLSGLPPGATIEITAERAVDYPRDGRQRSLATFIADGSGRIDVSNARPLSGTFDRIDPSSLFWSMSPNYLFSFGAKSNEVQLTAYLNSAPVARSKVVFQPSAVPITEEAVPGFQGAFLLRPEGTTALPAIILLGGGEGNDYFARSLGPRLAGQGFAVLGLPYYSPRSGWQPNGQFPTLPAAFEELPVERLDAAYRWLRQQPRIDGNRIGLMGQSRGAELALVASTVYPWIRATAAIVPTDVVTVGWGGSDGIERSPLSLRGKALAFVPAPALPRVLKRLNASLPGETMRDAYEAGRLANPVAAARARIPVERFRGALLVAGAEEDTVWSSARAALAISERRAASGLSTSLNIFSGAGHALAGTGWEPPPSGLGGNAEDTARAQRSLWDTTIAFFRAGLD